jgi:NDP-sugar pyrophosphorylase family protein
VNDVAKTAATFAARPPVIYDTTARIGAGAQLGPAVVLEPRVTVGSQSELSRCLVLPGTVLPSEARHASAILGPGFVIPVDFDA